MYILIPFPALIPGLLLLPVLASLFIDNLFRSNQDKKYHQLVLTTLFSVAGLVGYGVISLGLVFIMATDEIFWLANGIILPSLIVFATFWLKRKSLEIKGFTRKDIFAAIIYIALVFAFISMSEYFLDTVHMVLISIFPGLIGLFLSTKVSHHTWKFFVANITFSISSFILYGILVLGFSAQ